MHLGDTDLRVHGGDEPKRQWLREHVKEPLEKAKSTGQRIAVLARFFSWLRKVALELSPSTDPTFGMLERPSPGRPATDKKAITEARFREIRAELEDGPYRWAFDVLMATGRHVREIRRFAQAGVVEALPDGRPLASEGRPQAAAVLALPFTKAGCPPGSRSAPRRPSRPAGCSPTARCLPARTVRAGPKRSTTPARPPTSRRAGFLRPSCASRRRHARARLAIASAPSCVRPFERSG